MRLVLLLLFASGCATGPHQWRGGAPVVATPMLQTSRVVPEWVDCEMAAKTAGRADVLDECMRARGFVLR